MKEVGLDRFLRFMADWAASVISPIATNQRKVEDFPDQERKLFDDVFRRFMEINETIENLDLCLDFIKGPMPRRKGLKLDRFLVYHITFYLQEMYILNERLESYAKIIMRIKKRLDKSDPVDKRYAPLIESVRQSLRTIVKVRGAHVHHRSFSDSSMDQLSVLSLISTFKSEFAADARFEYRLAKDKWVQQIEQNRAALKSLLHRYFDFIYKELTEGSAPVLPNIGMQRTRTSA